MTKFATFLC